MKSLQIVLFACLAANPISAEPFDIFDSPTFGIGSRTHLGPLNSYIEELGISGPFRAQSEAVELLGSEFARAAAQGLIEAQETPSKSVNKDLSGTLVGRSNLSVVTGLDRDGLAAHNLSPTATGAICVSDKEVDLASWGGAADHNQLGKLRAGAISEDGKITPAGALKLARYYIARGFGAEAKALTKYLAKQSDQDLIGALASIIDTGESYEPILSGQIFCEGTVSLWAALARPISPTKLPKSTDSILVSFAELPIHLRSHLGPLLAERLRNAGLDEQARHVLNAILRSGTTSEESALETAKLGLSGTQPEVARQQLISLSNGTDIVAAKALLALLSDAARQDIIPPTAWVEDVPSLVRATEGTQVSMDLNLAGLNGLIRLGKFDRVRLALNEKGPGLTDQTKPELARKALAAATAHATTEVFLRSVVGFGKFFKEDTLRRNDRFAVADRLSGLGLSLQASAFMPNNPKTVEERRIVSKILSENGHTSSAIAVLEETPMELRSELASLHAQAGNIPLAIESFAADGQNITATFLAIQSGDWNWVSMNGEGTASDATQALINPIETDSTKPNNGKLITQTQVRRLQADKLLRSLRESAF